jgi:hypothetical protein
LLFFPKPRETLLLSPVPFSVASAPKTLHNFSVQKGLLLLLGLLLLNSLCTAHAQTVAISALATTGAMLSPGDRQAIADAGIKNGNWLEMATTLRGALLADRNGFSAINPAWSQRLQLCELLYWLGQNETEQAALYISTRIVDKEGKYTVEKLRDALRDPAFLKQVGPRFFIDEADYPKDQILGARLNPDTLQAILTNADLVEQLAETISRDDYLPGVFRVLSDLRQHAPDTFTQFPALDVALAVVYDQPFPPHWPHSQVPRESLPLDFGNWNALFDYFTAAAQAHELLMDIQKLRADQLKFMVDAPLKIEELQWAKKNIHQSRGRFEEVFSIVKYDIERAKTNVFNWPGTEYTLDTISKSGGICVDQAYFAAIAGKAHGIPTLFFSGQGSDGGHAWFGFLQTDEKWLMDAGRYKNQKYVTGNAYDPQNWKVINDHQLETITNRLTLSPEYRHSNGLLILSTMSDADGDNTATYDLLQASLKAAPDNSAAWIGMAEFLRNNNQPDLLKTHLQAMTAQFENQGDLKTYALQQLIDIAKTQNDTTAVDDLQQQIVQANHLHRSDLSIAAGSDILTQKLTSQDYQGAYSEYKNLIRKLKSDGGGNLFYTLVRPFVTQLTQANQTSIAKDALAFARDALKPTPESILAKAFDQLGTEINAPVH